MDSTGQRYCATGRMNTVSLEHRCSPSPSTLPPNARYTKWIQTGTVTMEKQLCKTT